MKLSFHNRTPAPCAVLPRAPIQHLRTSCGPANVARLVPAFIVNSIQHQVRLRLGADVGKEGREVVQPLWADADSPPSVVSVPPFLRIGTTGLRATPRMVLRCLTAPMPRVCRLDFSPPQAPTRLCVSCPQVSNGNRNNTPARAAASGATATPQPGSLGTNRQIPENEPGRDWDGVHVREGIALRRNCQFCCLIVP